MISGTIRLSFTFLSIETKFASLVHVDCALSRFLIGLAPILTMLALAASKNRFKKIYVENT